jgi:hypothetical protein
LRREKRKGKEKEKVKEKERESKNKEEDEDKLDEKAKDDKACGMQLHFNYTSNKVQIKELSKNKDQAQAESGPRIYHLNKYVDCHISHFKHLPGHSQHGTDRVQELLPDEARQAAKCGDCKTQSRATEQPRELPVCAQR